MHHTINQLIKPLIVVVTEGTVLQYIVTDAVSLQDTCVVTHDGHENSITIILAVDW